MCEDTRTKASANPVLFHPDLHKRNIFVSEEDSSLIPGIIDWQGASIEPGFWYSDEVPGFAGPDDKVSAQTSEISTRFLTPALSKPRLMDENLFRPFRYSYRTWKDGAVALRHELIETGRHWSALGFPGQYPVSLLNSSADLKEHEKEYRLFEAAQNLRRDLAGLLNSETDGWVPLEEWKRAELAHREIFKAMLRAVLENRGVDDDEPVKDGETLGSIWAFDVSSEWYTMYFCICLA